MAGDELDLSIGEAVCSQICEHLVTEQMRMYGSCYGGGLAVFLHNLLDTPRREWPAAPRLEQVPVTRTGPEVGLEYELETCRKQDVAVSVSFSSANEDL